MLKKLGSLMGVAAAEVKGSPTEYFGKASIARRHGEDVLRATAARRNYVQGIRDRLTSMTREEKDELVDRLFARVALFVYDLPASESSHHCERFGLLDHLLEVAHQTARDLASPGFQISPEPSINHRERPLWIYSGVAAAVLHDLGKPLDLDVAVPGKGTCWDPRAEPLKLFCLRNELPETGPGIWHHRPGRGTDGHERHIATVLPIVLPQEVERYLGPRWASVLAALTSDKSFEKSSPFSHPAREVVRVMRRADQASSQRDREARHGKTDAFPAPEPAPPCAFTSPRPGSRDLPQPQGIEGAVRRKDETREVPTGSAASPDVPEQTHPEESLWVPSDFWAESVPDPRERRGDAVEIGRRLAVELDPSRFLDTIRRMIVSRRFSRNNLYTDIYVRPDYIWLVLPRALRRLALINHLPFDTEILKRMLASLGKSPHVEPTDKQRVPTYMKPRPDSNTFEAVRIKTPGFISAIDQVRLGYYTFAIHAIDPMACTGAAG